MKIFWPSEALYCASTVQLVVGGGRLVLVSERKKVRSAPSHLLTTYLKEDLLEVFEERGLTNHNTAQASLTEYSK